MESDSDSENDKSAGTSAQKYIATSSNLKVYGWGGNFKYFPYSSTMLYFYV